MLPLCCRRERCAAWRRATPRRALLYAAATPVVAATLPRQRHAAATLTLPFLRALPPFCYFARANAMRSQRAARDAHVPCRHVIACHALRRYRRHHALPPAHRRAAACARGATLPPCALRRHNRHRHAAAIIAIITPSPRLRLLRGARASSRIVVEYTRSGARYGYSTIEGGGDARAWFEMHSRYMLRMARCANSATPV